MFQIELSLSKLEYVVHLIKNQVRPDGILSCPEDSFYQQIHYTIWHRKNPNYPAISRFSGFKF